MNKKVERRSLLSIEIYRKPQDKMSVVFLKRRKRYRLTSVLDTGRFMSEIEALRGLKGARMVQLMSPRGRNWMLEVVVEGSDALLRVWEILPGLPERLCFEWRGSPEEFEAALPRKRSFK